ncbi:hypothetical protein BD324DRAFT_256476 [Kockovaella imperatae]|uniref:Uncharacterized protein n=1 Tax=Kockovaella imperatae TaxID=4999 RepID=A0A1Y1URM6_9TREE|nr:hypothetical protein BD324DRAFT_256476 [Kockovaella imperatae]ORX40086.1 hypothetical protein BD324DRAFT_256476 [Kockovaella imperatae]
MASMEDLVATMRGGLHVERGNDLQELQNKLAQTLNPVKAPYRPIPPTSLSPNTSTIPPAPASSWNDAFGSVSPSNSTTTQQNLPLDRNGTSPRSSGVRKDIGFSIPPPKSQSQGQPPSQNQANAQSNVIGSDHRSEEDDGFRDDAFRPLWQSDSSRK